MYSEPKEKHAQRQKRETTGETIMLQVDCGLGAPVMKQRLNSDEVQILEELHHQMRTLYLI